MLQNHIPAKINKTKRNMSYRISDELYDILLHIYQKATLEQKTSIPLGYVFKNPKTDTKFVDLRKPHRKGISHFRTYEY